MGLGAARTLDRELDQRAGGRWGCPFWVPPAGSPVRLIHLAPVLHPPLIEACRSGAERISGGLAGRSRTAKRQKLSAIRIASHRPSKEASACVEVSKKLLLGGRPAFSGTRRNPGTPGYSRPLAEVTGVLYRGGVIKLPRARLPAAGAKILAMLTVNFTTFMP